MSGTHSARPVRWAASSFTMAASAATSWSSTSPSCGQASFPLAGGLSRCWPLHLPPVSGSHIFDRLGGDVSTPTQPS